MKITKGQILNLADELRVISEEIYEDRLPRWRDLGHNFSQAADTILALQNKVDALEEWIKSNGEQTDTCTYNALGVRCSYCECWRNK